MSVQLSRKAYAKKYGPTVGDRIRLADTELIIEIEHNYTDYGEESIFGGGKSIRDGQDQCPLEEPMGPEHCDLVITNAVIIDHWGIVKGDIGIRGGRMVGVGVVDLGQIVLEGGAVVVVGEEHGEELRLQPVAHWHVEAVHEGLVQPALLTQPDELQLVGLEELRDGLYRSLLGGSWGG